MLLIVGTVRLPSHKLAAARPVMKQMVEASRLEPGCIEYFYAEDLFEPGLIHVKELWNSQQALDRHFASNHLAQWRAAWSILEIGHRSLRVFQVDAGQPV